MAESGNIKNNNEAAIRKYISTNKGAMNDLTNRLKKAPDGFDFSKFKEGEALVAVLTSNFGDQLAKRFESGNAINDPDFKSFKLHSGGKEDFIRVTVEHSQIEILTRVPADINARTQEQLDESNLWDILESIDDGQYYEAIGYLDENGKIVILDGSRRRAACLIAGKDYQVYVCQNAISNKDAKILATRLQTAKEHNIQEKGRSWQSLKDEGYLQKDLAEMFNTSEATISRGLKANQVDRGLMSLFPDPTILTTSQWNKLHEFTMKQLPKLGLTAAEAVDNLQSSDAWKLAEEKGQLTTAFVIDNLGKHKPKIKSAKTGNKFVNIASYTSKTYVKSNNNSDSFQLKFGRISNEHAKELERITSEYMDSLFKKQ